MLHILSFLLAALLTLLQLGDWLTTRRLILTGAGREGNPAMAWLIKVLGLDPALIVKGLMIAGFGVSLASGAGSSPPPSLAVLNLVYLWVVFHNWRILRGTSAS